MRDLNMKRRIILSSAAGIILLIFTVSFAADWGTIIYPRSDTNIRAKRSVASKLKGQLKAGQPVKVDFLRNSWYAVFKVTEKRRNEKMARDMSMRPVLLISLNQTLPDQHLMRKNQHGIPL